MCACQGTDEHGDVKRDVTANPKYSNTARPTGRTVNYPEWNPGVKHGERLIIRKGFRFTCLLALWRPHAPPSCSDERRHTAAPPLYSDAKLRI
jgi:hypothetical protein